MKLSDWYYFILFSMLWTDFVGFLQDILDLITTINIYTIFNTFGMLRLEFVI